MIHVSRETFRFMFHVKHHRKGVKLWIRLT
nr:MAG TPA: gamma-glutamyl phosphate reductase [Caudoviricetes sp.]